MSTNQERRAEARQRLRDQMEAQARRDKQLKIAGAAVVVVLLLGLVGFVVWKKMDEAAERKHAEEWTSDCKYPPEELPEKQDPKAAESQGGAQAVKMVEEQNKQLDEAKKKQKKGTAPEGEQPKKGTTDIVLGTDRGDIPVSLDHGKAPCNVASFEGLVKQTYFDGSPCHRLVAMKDPSPLFALQCGDPTGTGIGGPGYSVQDEAPKDLPQSPDGQSSIYPRGTIAMAKSQTPDSGGSQFFLVYKDSYLPPQYSVMGTITDVGLKVLDEIDKTGVKDQKSPTGEKDIPKNPITIKTATVAAENGLPEKDD